MKTAVGLGLALAVVAMGCTSRTAIGLGSRSSAPASIESPSAAVDMSSGPIEEPSASADVPSGPAEWWVDPADLPLPASSTTIHGLLLEQACHGFASPEGRIVGPEITYGVDRVVITFRVRPLVGGATCPGTPPSPVTITLKEPLAGRTLIDGGSNRDATIDPTIVLVPDENCGPLVGTNDTKRACESLIGATLGDRYRDFATVSVMPDGDACPGDACTTTKGIVARTWRVDATDRQGQSYQWRCTYLPDVATCKRAGP